MTTLAMALSSTYSMRSMSYRGRTVADGGWAGKEASSAPWLSSPRPEQQRPSSPRPSSPDRPIPPPREKRENSLQGHEDEGECPNRVPLSRGGGWGGRERGRGEGLRVGETLRHVKLAAMGVRPGRALTASAVQSRIRDSHSPSPSLQSRQREHLFPQFPL